MIKICTKMLLIMFLIMNCVIHLNAESSINDSTDTFSLENLLNETVATASKFTQNVSDAPSSVTIINNEDIKKYGWRTLNDALKSVKSFFFSYDRSYIYMGVRGFQIPSSYNNKILVLIDGKPFNEKIYGGSFFGNEIGFDLDFIEKIEIVNGPGSVLYGTGAFFGVINLISKSANRINGTKLFSSVGSFGEQIANFISGYSITNEVNLSLAGKIGTINGQDLYYKEYDTDSTNHGIAANLDKENMAGLYGKINYKNLGLSAYYFSREKYIPTAYWETMFNAPDNKFSDTRLKINLDYNYQLDNNKNLDFNFSYDEYKFNSTYPYLIEDKKTIYSEFNDGKWFGGELKLNWDLQENNNLVAGVEYVNVFKSDYHYGESTNPFLNFEDPSSVFSFYLLDNFGVFENLELSAGIRYDTYSIYGSAINPRVALIYTPIQNSNFKLIYGSAYRIPSLYERLYNDPGRFKSNPNIKSENIKSIDFVFEQTLTNNSQISCDLYYNFIDNLIDTRIDEKDSIPYFDNLISVNGYGIELEYKHKFIFGLNATLSYAYTNSYHEDNKKEANYPDHLIKLNVNYQINEWLYTGLNSYYESERVLNNISVSEDYTPSFLLLDFNLGLNIDLNDKFSIVKQIFVTFKALNILDTKYSFPAGVEFLQKSIQQDGIAWRCNFGFLI